MILLPGFDEYLLGYTDRGAALAPHHAPLTVPGNNGCSRPPLCSADKWLARGAKPKGRPRSKGNWPASCFRNFWEIRPAQAKALEKQAARYAAYLNTRI
ncbi:hypothetical protein NHF46_18810 [Arthrobacter alpinus]|nr:hypothetical protein [Arthrobacter alpinus]